MVLTPSQARKFYNRFGKKQDAQAFYEDAALDDLIAHAKFEKANNIFEFGCGTGRFALQLLGKHLPHSAAYFGIDISETMIDIAAERLAPYSNRAEVALSDGSTSFPLPDHSIDRVISTFVFDLLSESEICHAISEAHRVLSPNGKLCLVSITAGKLFPARIVSDLWSALFRLHAMFVGGCRPVELTPFFMKEHWAIDHCVVISKFGIPSEVLIASPSRT